MWRDYPSVASTIATALIISTLTSIGSSSPQRGLGLPNQKFNLFSKSHRTAPAGPSKSESALSSRFSDRGVSASPPIDGLALPSIEKVVQDDGEHLQRLGQGSYFESPSYDSKYQVHGGGNYFGHEESRNDIQTRGLYYVLLPDGRRQVVSYYADESGYHPTITYEVVHNLDNLVPALKPTRLEGYRPKRSWYYKHSKRVSQNSKQFKMSL